MIKIDFDSSKFEKQLNDLLKDIDKAAKDTIKDGCPRIMRSAKKLCPVDSGDLRDSITDRYEDTSYLHTGDVYTNCEYAHFVELGTINRAPEPFLYPAFKEYEDFIRRQLIDTINKSMR